MDESVTHLIWFRPYSEVEARPDLEINVDVSEAAYVPKFLSEGPGGEIVDLLTDRNWPSLAAMTQDLKIVILDWRLACLN